jgi:uncharacterized protein Usg
MFSRTWPNPVANTFAVTWDRVGFETVTLSYTIEDEVQFYQSEYGWGSFCLALGIPTFLTAILDWAKKLLEPAHRCDFLFNDDAP